MGSVGQKLVLERVHLPQTVIDFFLLLNGFHLGLDQFVLGFTVIGFKAFLLIPHSQGKQNQGQADRNILGGIEGVFLSDSSFLDGDLDIAHGDQACRHRKGKKGNQVVLCRPKTFLVNQNAHDKGENKAHS